MSEAFAWGFGLPLREQADSNHQSHSRERLFCALPIGDSDTEAGATCRFSPETAMLGWSSYL